MPKNMTRAKNAQTLIVMTIAVVSGSMFNKKSMVFLKQFSMYKHKLLILSHET